MKSLSKLIIFFFVVLLSASCRHNVVVTDKEIELPDSSAVLYILNEGNMGSNKATIDMYDINGDSIVRDIYPRMNPSVVKELGDVGNDIAVYGGKMYIVVNVSGKVEVTDTECRRITQISIPNCRNIAFFGGYAYVSSYAGPIDYNNPDYKQRGYIARIDTATLTVTDTCLVGYQPNGIATDGVSLYVANSGGYMAPDYDSTVSVIDLNTFKEIKRIAVAKNLWRVRPDCMGQLWVSSRGDYYDTPAKLYCIDTGTDAIIDSVSIAVSALDILGDTLYACATAWDYVKMADVITYTMLDVRSRKVVSTNFITDQTDKEIGKPYGIKVHPLTRDIYITDAKNYVNPGMLHCYSADGKLKWSVRTGDIPAHFAMVKK